MYKAKKEHEVIDDIDNFNDFLGKRGNERYTIQGSNKKLTFYIEDSESLKEYLEFKKNKENNEI